MDLRRSAPPSSSPSPTLTIPTARRPLQTPGRSRPPLSVELPFGRSLGAAASAPPALRFHRWIGVAEGSLLLVGLYMLIGAGIGDIAGSVMVGVAAGLIAGVFAVAAILLISGSALTARAATDRSPRRAP